MVSYFRHFRKLYILCLFTEANSFEKELFFERCDVREFTWYPGFHILRDQWKYWWKSLGLQMGNTWFKVFLLFEIKISFFIEYIQIILEEKSQLIFNFLVLHLFFVKFKTADWRSNVVLNVVYSFVFLIFDSNHLPLVFRHILSFHF